ncbi:HD domain-containing protein [Rutstroemia sp. NJR-2017a BVV2]|nr:HD domain-containing protein [Rutstroemia sp. NJR-2017a BVV2]
MSEPQELIKKVEGRVREFMAKYDASHDFNHIKRVVRRAYLIHDKIIEAAIDAGNEAPKYDMATITLSAMLHDIGDRKYVQDGQDATTMVRDLLIEAGADDDLAQRVQTICLGVSYNSEIKDLEKVRKLIEQYPELAIVQDADRLDSIGAIGIGRAFCYGGAKTERSMDETIAIFDSKLLKLEPLMKTEPGREMAQEATARLRVFRQWWKEEIVLENEYEVRFTS